MSSLLLATVLSVCTVGSTIPLPYLRDLYQPISVHGHTGVRCVIFPPFPHICYSAVQHTHFIMSLYVLFFCQHWACWYDVLCCLFKLLTQSAICCLFLFVIFLLPDIWFVMPDSVLLLFQFPVRSPLDSHRNVPYAPISCLYTLPLYWPCITLLSHSFFKDSPNLAFMHWVPAFCVSLCAFDWSSSPANFIAILIL